MFFKDGKDEDSKMCGNFYGSNVMRTYNDNKGKRIFNELLAFYNITTIKQYDRACGKLC